MTSAREPVSAERRTFLYGANVRANGIRQHYLRYGGWGPIIVLVPGITSPAITWGFVAERLGRDHDVYVIDVRGRGLSETGYGLDYGLDACADDVTGLIAELGLDGVGLLGHSMGARIAIRKSVRSDAGLWSLGFVDPPVSGPGRRSYPSDLRWYMDSIEAAGRGMSGQAMRAFCPTWSDEQLRLRAEWLHTCHPPAIKAAYDGFHSDDVHRDLPRLPVKAFLVVAGRGGVVSESDIAEIASLQPSIDVRRVPDAGHMIPWDDLEGFLDALGPFLNSLPRRREPA